MHAGPIALGLLAWYFPNRPNGTGSLFPHMTSRKGMMGRVALGDCGSAADLVVSSALGAVWRCRRCGGTVK